MKVKPNVFIICPGVGHINRGYESFTVECFNELKSSEFFELFLLKGAGNHADREIRISCIRRNSKLSNYIAKIFSKEPYWIEQFSFFIGMLPKLIRYRPSVVYYSDFILGTFLWHLQKYIKFKYRLLFSNGAPNGPPFSTMHHVQQLLNTYMDDAIKQGAAISMQTLIPYGFSMKERFNQLTDKQVESERLRLGLPVGKKIIISVGAINCQHKRMDYVVREFAHMNHQEYFLVLLGQIDELSIPIFELAKKILPKESYVIQQVTPNEVVNFLACSNYFVLASLTEGFGRVLIEAQCQGLLPIVHDYNVMREVLKNFGVYGNLKQEKILPTLIKEVDELPYSKYDIWEYAYKNYSWKALKGDYEQMILNNTKW